MTAPTAPLPVDECLPWCAGHPERHLPPSDVGDGWTHSWRIAEGERTRHAGPVYTVTLDQTDEGVRLYVSVETSTLTADQADVLGRALIKGARALRANEQLAARDVLCPPYWGVGGRLVHPPAFIPTATDAEGAIRGAHAG